MALPQKTQRHPSSGMKKPISNGRLNYRGKEDHRPSFGVMTFSKQLQSRLIVLQKNMSNQSETKILKPKLFQQQIFIVSKYSASTKILAN